MRRQILSLVLIPCLLIAQPTVLDHFHDQGEPSNHDFRPHFHASVVLGGHHHDHRCPHDDNDHDDSDGHHHHDPVPDEPTHKGARPTKPSHDHDADAIFLAVADSISGECSHQKHDPISFVALTLFERCTAAGPDLDRWGYLRCCGPGPPSIDTACPLYVRYLTLLI
jgi:hypothetical protein